MESCNAVSSLSFYGYVTDNKRYDRGSLRKSPRTIPAKDSSYREAEVNGLWLDPALSQSTITELARLRFPFARELSLMPEWNVVVFISQYRTRAGRIKLFARDSSGSRSDL